MRLLQINVTANWGSTGRIAEDIGQLALENGWESWIAYGRNCNSSKSKLIRIGSDYDIKRHAIYSRLFDNHGLSSKNATKHFIDTVKEISPDVIHLHNIHGYYLNYELLFRFLKEWGGPVVWTLHDIWPITGHCAYFGVEECQKWLSGCGSCKRLNTYPQSILLDRSFSNFRRKKELFSKLENLTLVPVSNWLSELIGQSFMAQYPRITIHNGIDTDIFSPGLKADSPYIVGVVSVLEERNGLQDFIRLRELLPNEILIKLVGLTETQCKGLPKGIIGVEHTNSAEDLANLYSSALAFVNPTYEDNFPKVYIEALSFGTPVVTYKTVGYSEAMDFETCIVVEKGDVKGISDAIMSLLESDIIRYKEECRARALSLFSRDNCYKEYLDEYLRSTNVKMRGYVICVASVWNREKGFDDIIHLRKQIPSSELIVMVGVTASQKKLLPKGIIGIERTSNIQDLAMLYAGADVFINPTWGDNFPTVNIEALACATPIITYCTGGSPEAVDNECGTVVAQGDIKDISESILRIKQKPEFYSSAYCRIKAVREFDKSITYNKYIYLYNSVLANR